MVLHGLLDVVDGHYHALEDVVFDERDPATTSTFSGSASSCATAW